MDTFESTVHSTINSLPGGLHTIQLVVMLLAGRYAMHSKLLHYLFDNAIGSAILLWLTALISFNNNVMTATYVALGLWIVNVIARSFFPPTEGFFNGGVYPGCSNMTNDDMLKYFNGDEQRLRRAMYNSVNTNYENPALSATQLVNHGYSLGDKCKLP